MSIVLRTNKGSALTYDEMDRNQSQFFYSSSKSPDGSRLRLHYTGSDNLDTTEDYGPSRYHEIAFPTFESEVPDSNVAGDNTQIQFNNNGNFGADPVFVFTNTNHSVGIGTTTPLQRLDVVGDGARGGNIALRGSINHEGEIQSLAGVKFYSGLTDATLLGRVGRIEYSNSTFADDIFIHSGNHDISSGLVPDLDTTRSVHISLGNTTPSTSPASRIGATFKRTGNSSIKVGINNTNPGLNLSIVGNSGVGVSDSSLEINSHSRLKPIISSNAYHSKVNGFGAKVLVPNNSTAAGLEISSPKTPNGGNILMVINTDASEQNEGFNIITTTESSAANATLLATFQASGKVGIGTNFPSHEGLTVQKELTIKTRQVVGTTPTSEITTTLVADNTGLVKEVVAAPVPKGGIIMWSGTIANIPSGWRLCGAGGGAVNGIQIPDLTDKFVVGATADGADSAYPGLQGGATGGSKDAIAVSHTHGITDPGHRHIINHRRDSSASGNFQTLEDTSNSDEGSWSSNGLDNGNLRSIVASTGISVNSAGSPGTNKNLPPYYALAFIIYVGV